LHGHYIVVLCWAAGFDCEEPVLIVQRAYLKAMMLKSVLEAAPALKAWSSLFFGDTRKWATGWLLAELYSLEG